MAGTRVDVSQAVTLKAMLKALRAIPNLENNVKLVLDPEATSQPEGEVFVTLTLAGGEFPPEFQLGGGKHQCTERTKVMVSIWTRIMSDEAGAVEDALLDFENGLLSWKMRVLRQLVETDLQYNYPDGQGGTNTFMRQLGTPTNCSAPQRDDGEEGSGYLGMSLGWLIEFDWDLTS